MKVEVLGAERRRRWRDDEKARIVAETLDGTARVSEVARRHDVCPSLVFTWRRQVRQGRLGGVTEVSSLLPVMIQAEKPPAVSETQNWPTRSRHATCVIEIALGRGRRVRVDRDVDAAALRLVLDPLSAR
ncbi:IS66-like element accessory protein TnpA [Xanthobacter autotrophicus]|uniref:IS66-like element accessory protein TnpA n=1 Tax=Xanthobacter autotrophicus TaxID=280 RepID=UPI0024A74030|nr:transposase [Xanthobacter autotrophicus]MDI4657205.1 transposase [Xanthobacter autotrophicus]